LNIPNLYQALWVVGFLGYTAYYVNTHDPPENNTSDGAKKIEQMSEAERFMARNVEVYEDYDQ
jgi:3-deoxy-D-manno-octulosonic acid (KDO) 8-phosphate synthase